MSVINSHNSWSQLEEVWLGDVYPVTWYDHLEPSVRDVFQAITEITKQDLATIQLTLESLGVTVCRPEYHSIDSFVDAAGVLTKPEICPRDTFLTQGTTLLTPGHPTQAWTNALHSYDRGSVKAGANHIINGANVVRVGHDVVIDTDIFDVSKINFDLSAFRDYRITWVKNGGHMDGCFAILRPGLILANQYFEDYEKTFPGWECIFLNEPTYWQHRKTPPTGSEYNGKFYVEGVAFNQSFNQHVIQHAETWVGNYTETFFELNCLVVNESTVVMLGYNAELEKTLNSRGITVHWVPFRCRGFWDGGMHCITLDIHRNSTAENFFPNR